MSSSSLLFRQPPRHWWVLGQTPAAHAMHPDQSTPDSHRYQSSDSGEAPHKPDISQQAEGDMEDSSDQSAAEMEDGARVAEAGNAYVGRMMDDDLKTSPRVEDGDEAVDEDPTTARDD